MNEVRSKNMRPLVMRLAVATVAMFAFGFALVPLYNVFCDITGLNGKTADGPVAIDAEVADEDRWVTVQFLAAMNGTSPWEFRPLVRQIKVHPGKLYQTSYFARNLREHATVAQAVPSVSPGKAAAHFSKTECFCFTRQVFAPGEGRDMPLSFMISAKLPPEIGIVTLSYTFFELEEQVEEPTGGTNTIGGKGV